MYRSTGSSARLFWARSNYNYRNVPCSSLATLQQWYLPRWGGPRRSRGGIDASWVWRASRIFKRSGFSRQGDCDGLVFQVGQAGAAITSQVEKAAFGTRGIQRAYATGGRWHGEEGTIALHANTHIPANLSAGRGDVFAASQRHRHSSDGTIKGSYASSQESGHL
jgi:hypothetical protein